MKLLLNDASALLNLLAADCLADIADALGLQLVICPLVRDEVKKLRDVSTGEMVPIDIFPYIESGLLLLMDLSGEDEEAFFVGQTAIVDDGEAMSITLAVCRKIDLAIDDKQARSHLGRNFPSVKLWSTPEIIKRWSETVDLSSERLKDTILQIEGRARYRPPKTHPLADWWQNAAG